MRITHFDKEQLKRQEVNIFVKNLGLAATNASLYSLFKSYGEIFSSKLAQNLDGRSKGYGFVQYLIPENAQKAVTEMNGKSLENIKLIVEPYKQKENRLISKEFNNIYVKNLPESITTQEALDKLFAPFGERVSVSIGQHELKGKVGYFGFVAFKKPEDATKAVAELNGKTVEGSSLYLGKALTKEERERDKRKNALNSKEVLRKVTCYVKSSTGNPLSEELIKAQLGEFGVLKQINVLKRKDSQGNDISLPIAFAVFEKEEMLRKAITEYNKPGKPLIISQLENKQDRTKRLKRARTQKRGLFNPMARSGMMNRLQGRYNYLLGMRGRVNANRLGVDRRMLVRPFYMMRPLIHPYPQRLAVPMVCRLA